MSASLVGSEMCIRDSLKRLSQTELAALLSFLCRTEIDFATACSGTAVSYTHLTLPTICSV
eukprot:12960171-Alexandrium_andersonii.AAC.1